MGISIKHDEIERLIRELAHRRGSSLTDAIGEAVRNELEREVHPPAQDSLRERIRQVQAMVAAMPVLDSRTADQIIGYDEHGLPS